MIEPVLAVRSLTVEYRQRHDWIEVVSDVSFEIAPGEVLGLAGELGCGKSTIAYALLGERPPGSRIRQGSIVFVAAISSSSPSPRFSRCAAGASALCHKIRRPA